MFAKIYSIGAYVPSNVLSKVDLEKRVRINLKLELKGWITLKGRKTWCY